MRINTSDLDRVLQEYNPDHDLGPEAPVHWSVGKLAQVVGRLVEVIEELDAKITIQEQQIEQLQDEASEHRFSGKH